jgi:hypothetical protein
MWVAVQVGGWRESCTLPEELICVVTFEFIVVIYGIPGRRGRKFILFRLLFEAILQNLARNYIHKMNTEVPGSSLGREYNGQCLS